MKIKCYLPRRQDAVMEVDYRGSWAQLHVALLKEKFLSVTWRGRKTLIRTEEIAFCVDSREKMDPGGKD